MVKRTRKTRRLRKLRKLSKIRHSKRRIVGGDSGSYSFAMKPVYGGVPDSNQVMREGCNAALRPGILGGQSQGSGTGLPMSGGRYEFTGQVDPSTGMWTSGGSSIPCEGSLRNPLNSGYGTPSTNQILRQSGGMAGVDQAYSGGVPLQETTAGYTHLSDGGSVGRLSDGSPFMLNNPVAGRVGVSAACLTAGGSRRKSRSKRQLKARSRGQRKSRSRGQRKARSRGQRKARSRRQH